MSVTLYEDQGGYGNFETFFDGGAANLEKYYMSFYSTWNDETSALYTTGYTYVFEDAIGEGDSALLSPGFWDTDELADLGIDNDSISSFYEA